MGNFLPLVTDAFIERCMATLQLIPLPTTGQFSSRDVIDVVRGFFNSTAADMEWKMFIVSFTRVMEIVGYSISFVSIAISIFILSHFRSGYIF